MRRSSIHFLAAAVLAGAGLALTGCAGQPTAKPQPLPPLVGPDGGRQTLVLDPPTMRRAAPPAARRPGRLPWYAYRSDLPRSVTVGTAGPTVQTSYTRTVDRLGSFHGNVIDHYHRRTYRTRYRETVH
jgi:hypothetical protein